MDQIVEFGQGTVLYDQLFNNQVKLKYKFKTQLFNKLNSNIMMW